MARDVQEVGQVSGQGSWQERWSTMECDSGTLTGGGHLRAGTSSEDCAIHGRSATVGWGIVSDGCSSGGERTDFGARLWAMAVEADLASGSSKLLKGVNEGGSLGNHLAAIAPSPMPGMEAQDMIATVAFVCADKKNVWGVIAGDGAVVAVYEDGALQVVMHSFTLDAPFYPQFVMDAAQMRAFISKSRAKEQRMKVERIIVDSSGLVFDKDDSVIAIDNNQEFAGNSYLLNTISPIGNGARIVAAIAMTDGIESLSASQSLSVIKEICQARAWRQDFLRDRLGALGRDWDKARSYPDDDLSVAGMCWPKAV